MLMSYTSTSQKHSTRWTMVYYSTNWKNLVLVGKWGLGSIIFLSDRTQFITANGATSTISQVISSVPQGTVLGPILFLILIGDINANTNSHVSSFSDDTRVLLSITDEDGVKTLQNKAIRDGKYLARHMPVLGNVHHIKIENFDIFSWRHFSARPSFYIINWYGYPRGSHEKYLKEIVSPVFEIHHWIVTC